MTSNLWFQSTTNDDGGPVCRALRYRDGDQNGSSFVATLLRDGQALVHEGGVPLDELLEIAVRFQVALATFNEANRRSE